MEFFRDLDSKALDTLDSALPTESVSFLNLSYRLRRVSRIHRGSAVYDAGGTEASAERNRYLAPRLGTLATRLSILGRNDEALAASEECLAIYRQLAADRPTVVLPDLATSLNNTGLILWKLGRREQALAVSEEAVVISRRQAEADPRKLAPTCA